ncbi:ankyrin repeat domain-containing protein [Paraphoma chrysanthemicola]|nr:ankyrin repeat domain-containing protein [Paraphoma chrysanthemicola]
MDPLSATASIISILQLSSKVLGYLNDVKDASKDRAKCAIEASHLNSLLTALRFRLEEGDSNTPWYTAVRALATENGPLDQFKLALEQLQSKITGGGKSNAFMWKFKKEEVVSILGRIERLKTLVEVAMQMDHFKLSQAIKECGDVTLSNTETIKDDTSFIRHEANLAQHSKLMAWISPIDFPAQQSDFIGRRQHGTGQWFLDATEVAQWLPQPRGTLFCPGIPGAGKTMIAAIAVDHLLKTTQSSSVGVAYVYCNYNAQEEQDTTNLLAAILKQLVQARLSLMEPVEQLHKQHAMRRTRPSVDEIFAVLQSVLAKFSAVYVIVDALDECRDGDGTRRLFLAKLRDLQAKTDLRLMITSRFIPGVVDEFKTALRLDVQASDEDVKRFVAGQIYRLPKRIQRDTALQEIMQEKIVEAVGGMFILARLHTDSLLDKSTPKEVKSTLAKLSNGSAALDKAYGEALQRIEGQLSGDLERAKKLLSWITYAKRPLTTAEICCALAVEPEGAELDPENVPDVEDLVSVCAGLVVVDAESAVIRLVHYTTQEYFERIREQWNPSAQLDIASTCLTYLCFDAFKTGSCSSDEDFEERLRQSKFLDYATKHWGEHAAAVEDEVCELACSFLFHSGLVSSAVQVLLAPSYRYKNYSQTNPKGTTGLHMAARSGLFVVSERFLSKHVRETAIAVNRKDSNGQTPLYLATQHGHKGMAELLLDKGANVNAWGGEYGNALQAASLRGHEQVVKLLLDKGADPNAQGGEYGNALYAASLKGHKQVVKLLLDKGADPNAQRRSFGNALQAASEEGHEQVVKLLLDKGADPNAEGDVYGSALYAAILRGHEQVVKLLLDKGADPNAQGRGYDNALYTASSGGHGQIVKLVLDNGANVNAWGGKYGNALQAASEEGHEQVVKLLLDKDADPNAQGGFYSNALQAASSGGHEQVVKLLLHKGADPNAQGGEYGNALQAASLKGHEQVVKLLLHKGAGSNAQGGVYGNALYAASSRGYEQVVKLLLDKDVNPNAQGQSYGNVLYAASLGGHKQVVKLLLHKGADPDAQGGKYGNALQAASSRGHEQVVKLLLDKGANPNAQCGKYSNALYAASLRGHGQVAKLLLDKGADSNTWGGFYGNALQAASSRGHEQVVKLLLDKDADPNAQGGFYSNALQAASSGGHEQVVKLLLHKGATRPIQANMTFTY